MSLHSKKPFAHPSNHLPPRSRINTLVLFSLMGMSAGAVHAADEVATPDASLPTVTVTGKRDVETATTPIKGYLAKRSTAGTKTDTPISETAQSISVITRDRMTDQAVQTTEQALRYTAGVLTEVTGYDLRYQSLVVRGFYAANYRDGLKTFAAGDYSDWVTEPSGVERVEVIKGPASVLYGQSDPGGIVNLTTKRPQAESIKEVTMAVGNHDRYQASIDVGGAVDSNGVVLVRFNGMVRDSKTQTDFGKDNRVYLAPALTLRPSNQTSITFLADYTQDRMSPKSWWPDKALLEYNPNGKIPVSRDVGEPSVDHYDRDMASFTYLLEHRFNQNVSVRQSIRYSDLQLDYTHVYGDTFDTDMRTVNRGTLATTTHGKALVADNQAQIDFTTGSLKHKTLLGVDFQDFRAQQQLGFGGAPTLDAFNPVYGAAFALPDRHHAQTKVQQLGVYAQNQMQVAGLRMNFGLRHDTAKTRNWNDQDADPGYNFNIDQHDTKTTYNAGVLYMTDIGLAPYASYATSFNPTVNYGFDFTPFKPETGQQFEVGLKYQPSGTNTLITASLFQLTKQNVATPDLVNTGYQVQTGEVRSRGLELEAVTTLWRQLDLTASYTYLDPKITRSNNPNELGKQARQTTKNSASVWANYRLQGESLHGWDVGAGLRYVDQVMASPTQNYYNPSYTLVDALVRYKSGPVTIAFNAANLFDKVYVSNFAGFYGQGRVLQATVSYRW